MHFSSLALSGSHSFSHYTCPFREVVVCPCLAISCRCFQGQFADHHWRGLPLSHYAWMQTSIFCLEQLSQHDNLPSTCFFQGNFLWSYNITNIYIYTHIESNPAVLELSDLRNLTRWTSSDGLSSVVQRHLFSFGPNKKLGNT